MKTLNILLEITIYSGILFCAIMLLKLCFKNKMSPFLHFVIWGLLIARLLLPVTLKSSVHLIVIPAEPISGLVQEPVQSPYTNTDKTFGANTSSAGQSQPQTNGEQIKDATASTAVMDKPTALQQALSLSVEEALLAVWLTGTGSGLLYLAVLYSVLRKRIQRNAEPPSKRLLELFDEVKAELNIKRDIRIIGQCEYGTPAVLFPNTVLMPINTLVSMNDAQVKFILRHELMHFKRNDHIFGLLLSLLNAIYWFNPIVWIALKKIRADMETACDSDVVRYFSSDERSTYAAIILSLFSKKQYGNLVLGMMQSNTRQVAEKRIRGVFMSNKTNKKVKIASILLAALLLFTCFTTACQPTPEEKNVVGKDEQQIEDMMGKIISTSASETKGPTAPQNTYTAPKRLEYTLSSELEGVKTTANINADVNVPEFAMPMAEVKPKNISYAQVKYIIDYFAKGQLIYDARIKELIKTKKDIQQSIDNYIQQIAECGDNEDMREIRESYQNNVKELYRDIQIAPGDYAAAAEMLRSGKMDMPETDLSKEELLRLLEPVTVTEDNYKSLSVFIDGSDNISEGSIHVNTTSNGVERLLASIKHADEPKGDDFTKDEATDLARPVVDALDSSLVLVDAGVSHEVDNNAPIYELVFARTYNGIETNYSSPGSSSMGMSEPLDVLLKKAASNPQYAPPYLQEFLRIVVSSQGVQTVEYQSPMEIVKTLSVDTELMPFDKIQEVFKKYIVLSASSNIELDEIIVNISRVELGMMRIKKPNTDSEYMVIPVWDFYGGRGARYTESGVKKEALSEIESEPFAHSLLTINAVNGSIIDRNLGY